jgi:quercetin 2,3-dioxygenase
MSPVIRTASSPASRASISTTIRAAAPASARSGCSATRFSQARAAATTCTRTTISRSAPFLQGELTHINTAGEGTVDTLRQGDYYVFSAGSGGKHTELSITREDMHAIYIWFLPNQLYLPPSYHRNHFDFRKRRNAIVQLVGDQDGALPIPQDVRVSRLISDSGKPYAYRPRSSAHGTYAFVLEGALKAGDITLGRRDSAGISGVEEILLESEADATDVLLVETILPETPAGAAH